MLDQDPAAPPTATSLHAAAWAHAYDLIDLQLSPLGLRAIERLRLAAGETVLDIGCGAGQTLLQLAERVGTGGQVIGVDVAPALLDIARRRAKLHEPIRLIQADAQRLDLPGQSIDAVFSRFGVMGFDDPIAAFANTRRMLRPHGRLAFTCWRPLRENALDHVPLAAAGFDSAIDETPFSFADPGYVRHILATAGFRQIVIQPHDEYVSSGNLDAMSQVLLAIGPLGKIMRENPALRAAAEPRVRAALATLGTPAKVQLMASVWIVTAGNGPAKEPD